MKIHQIYTDNALRNFSYIIELNNKNAFAVDPWNAEIINRVLTKNNLNLIAVINTHEHWDHVQGNQELVDLHDCEVWAHEIGRGKIPAQTRYLQAAERLVLDKSTQLEVIDTPGHSQAHLCFIIYLRGRAHSIFTGDIVFNAGVGNCHNGDVEKLYQTIQNKIATLPNDICILPGHEYMENNLKFTLDREPSNIKASQWLKKYQQSNIHENALQTTLADERDINTFLRLNEDEIKNNLPHKGSDEKETFMALRALRDKW